MASIKNLKKEINYTLGDLIDACSLSQLFNPQVDSAQSDAIVDEIIVTFDALIEKLNAKNVENKKAHFNGISKELEAKAIEIAGKINAL